MDGCESCESWIIKNLSTEELMLGKTDSKERKGLQRIRWLDSITSSMDMN